MYASILLTFHSLPLIPTFPITFDVLFIFSFPYPVKVNSLFCYIPMVAIIDWISVIFIYWTFILHINYIYIYIYTHTHTHTHTIHSLNSTFIEHLLCTRHWRYSNVCDTVFVFEEHNNDCYWNLLLLLKVLFWNRAQSNKLCLMDWDMWKDRSGEIAGRQVR